MRVQESVTGIASTMIPWGDGVASSRFGCGHI